MLMLQAAESRRFFIPLILHLGDSTLWQDSTLYSLIHGFRKLFAFPEKPDRIPTLSNR
jgi:hypothetical protein